MDPPSKPSISAVTKTLRDVLTSLAGRQRLSNDDLEVLFEQVDAKLARTSVGAAQLPNDSR